MLMTAKAREYRSKLRQKLFKQLALWDQKEKDMKVAFDLCAEDRAKKTSFIRQEKAKLQKALRSLDRGTTKQRAWSQGKLLY